MSIDLIYGIFFTTLTVLFYYSNKLWKKDRDEKNDGSKTFKIITSGHAIRKKITFVFLIFASVFTLLKALI
jgi:hypothetical protein